MELKHRKTHVERNFVIDFSPESERIKICITKTFEEDGSKGFQVNFDNQIMYTKSSPLYEKDKLIIGDRSISYDKGEYITIRKELPPGESITWYRQLPREIFDEIIGVIKDVFDTQYKSTYTYTL